MRFGHSFAIWLALAAFVAAQVTPRALVRFINDSAKAATLYLDGHSGCSVPANPEGNYAHCEAKASIGKHTVSIKGEKRPSQSCVLDVITRDVPGDAGAEAHLTKDGVLKCFSIAHD